MPRLRCHSRPLRSPARDGAPCRRRNMRVRDRLTRPIGITRRNSQVRYHRADNCPSAPIAARFGERHIPEVRHAGHCFRVDSGPCARAASQSTPVKRRIVGLRVTSLSTVLHHDQGGPSPRDAVVAGWWVRGIKVADQIGLTVATGIVALWIAHGTAPIIAGGGNASGSTGRTIV